MLFFWAAFLAWFPGTLYLYAFMDDYSIPSWGFLVIWFFFTFILIGTGWWVSIHFQEQADATKHEPISRDARSVFKAVLYGIGQYLFYLSIALGLLVASVFALILDSTHRPSPWIMFVIWSAVYLGLMLFGVICMILTLCIWFQVAPYLFGWKGAVKDKSLSGFPWLQLVILTMLGVGAMVYSVQQLRVLWA